MLSATQINYAAWAWLGVAVLIIPLTLRFRAPYGRHFSHSWGPTLDNRTGWILMELPALLVCPALFLYFGGGNLVASLLVGAWSLHYVNRTIVFPLRMRTKGKRIPWAIVAMALFFNGVNGAINGYFFGAIANYADSWLADPRFWLGASIWAVGLLTNVRADNRLLGLRKAPGDTYKIPRGGMFRWISCPNHFGEIVEWSGFALMAWSVPALSFAVWTIANLLPRALHHHQWYRDYFADYPQDRKAIIPGLL